VGKKIFTVDSDAYTLLPFPAREMSGPSTVTKLPFMVGAFSLRAVEGLAAFAGAGSGIATQIQK
jgi:hypothetical protein